MTTNVNNVLTKIYDNDMFEDELYFVGGTALAYYLNHRISEDIDIVSSSILKHRNIIPNMNIFGAKKLQDENTSALRLAGLVPDEFILKFVLDNVKIEFFQANRPIQKEILSQATFSSFENSKLKILDLKSIAKLKLVALVMRDKSRDLFDFGAILENKLFTKDEIIELFSKIDNKINSAEHIVKFIKSKKEPQDDEAVYLSQSNRIDLNFEEIKEKIIEEVAKFII